MLTMFLISIIKLQSKLIRQRETIGDSIFRIFLGLDKDMYRHQILESTFYRKNKILEGWHQIVIDNSYLLIK
jgi:hypothetical protein